MAPIQAPSIRRSPPMTAMIEQLDGGVEAHRRRRELPEPPGVEDAADRGDEGADPERERPVERDVVAERRHARGLVADALEGDAERRADDVPDQQVHEHGRDERDVVEALPVLDDVPDEARRVLIDPGDRREAADERDRADEEERDHRVRQRQHQEVDAVAPRRDGAEHEPDRRR